MGKKFTAGQAFKRKFTIDAGLIQGFAKLFGDNNPIHVDPDQAKAFGYSRTVAHGAILSGLLSRMIGTEVPGPGAVWMTQSIDWTEPVFAGDEIELEVTVKSISRATGVLDLEVVATNQNSKTVMGGRAQVKITEKLVESGRGGAMAGRIALVMGGSGSIGSAIAHRLSHQGMGVAVAYREASEAAARVAEDIRARGGHAQEFKMDLADPTTVSDGVQAVIDAFGRIDTVVHAASLSLNPLEVHSLSYTDLERHFRVSVGGPLAVVKAAVPGMEERKFGRFIFLGTAAMFGVPPSGWAAYLSAKHALWGLVTSLAAELGPKGITSNMVSPGLTVTALTEEIPARAKQVVAHKNPMRRLATSEDTGELVAFLASDAAGYINGANMPVSGGPG